MSPFSPIWCALFLCAALFAACLFRPFCLLRRRPAAAHRATATSASPLLLFAQENSSSQDMEPDVPPAVPEAPPEPPLLTVKRVIRWFKMLMFALSPFALYWFIFGYLHQPPVQSYQCPEFYYISFGWSPKDVANHIEKLGGPSPEYSSSEKLRSASMLWFSDLDREVAGVPLQSASCTFNSSQSNLSSFCLEFAPSAQNRERLVDYYTEAYGTPQEVTRPGYPGTYLHWSPNLTANISLRSDPLDPDDTLYVFYHWCADDAVSSESFLYP